MKQVQNSLPDGVYAACLTPLTESFKIDIVKMFEHCRWLLQNGCHGLVIFGTTGEANSFSVFERQRSLEVLIEMGLPAERLMVGSGSCNLNDAIELTRQSVSLGLGGALILPPFYYKGISDRGIFNYYAEIIKATISEKLQIYLYHIPQVSGVPISLELISMLRKEFPENICGIKDSSGDWNNTERMLKAFPGFRVFAGSEKFLLESTKRNGPGCISASTNAVSNRVRQLYDHRLDYNADELQKEIIKIRLQLEKFPMIPALKYIKSLAAKDKSWENVRPPLVRLNPKQKLALEVLINKYDLI